MENKELAKLWLKRTKSNLLRAGQKRETEEILYEDLVFDCQQCVEKSLKALCIDNDIDFPLTHNISKLFELLRENDIDLIENADEALKLTDYAVQSRYPGLYNPIDETEFSEAFNIASAIFDWSAKLIWG